MEFSEERRLFMGLGRSKNAALVCPALKQYVADEVAKDAAVLKERRKAREERSLLREGNTGASAQNVNAGKTAAQKRKEKAERKAAAMQAASSNSSGAAKAGGGN